MMALPTRLLSATRSTRAQTLPNLAGLLPVGVAAAADTDTCAIIYLTCATAALLQLLIMMGVHSTLLNCQTR